MIVNYQYNSLYILPEGATLPNSELRMLDDSDWQKCFRLLTEGAEDLAVRCSNPRRLMDYLHRDYINVKAAGGIVTDDAGRMLLMVRNGRSDLPKGKVEPGETLAQAALRETAEETGLTAIRLGQLALKTYHIYNLYGGWHFKQTTWYTMQLTEPQATVPQTEEGITQLLWLAPQQWRDRLQASYATMRVINAQVFDRPTIGCDG
ncbi:MAG: NUDIX domain-containing protein [Bacteroidales bacterium]|nr:NUDIX domain-containing protein [Bacteroidales bacterium]MBR6330611.1 NUDIX domain-containing protein [Bacteroidales bacterium]